MGTADGVCRGRRRPIRDRPCQPDCRTCRSTDLPGYGDHPAAARQRIAELHARFRGSRRTRWSHRGPLRRQRAGVHQRRRPYRTARGGPVNIKPEGPLARDDYRIDYEGIAFDDGVPINNVLPNGLRLGVDPAVVPRDGLPVCRVGITTGEACGAIAGFGNGWFLVDGVPAEHGDSGSAVYTVTSPGNAAIVGIVSARFTANQTRRESTVALSWPTVQQQIRNDIAASRRPEIASPVASNPQPPPPAINPQAPPMVLPPAPSDDRPSGPARMVVP